jgi:hypothetical protein
MRLKLNQLKQLKNSNRIQLIALAVDSKIPIVFHNFITFDGFPMNY